MDIEILDKPLEFNLYGVSGDVPGLDFAGTGMKLMDEMWKRVKAANLSHKGINFWVYDSADRMFTGIELQDKTEPTGSLEHKRLSLGKYAYFQHVGPYHKLGEIHREMEETIAARGFAELGIRVERYGHWTADETKLVTEIFIELN